MGRLYHMLSVPHGGPLTLGGPRWHKEAAGGVYWSMQYKPDAPVAPKSVVERINILRGLAIAGVIAVHTSAYFPQAGGLSPVVELNIAVDAFAHFAVPLFVLLSGLTLSLRYSGRTESFSAKAFYARRLMKIIPPYILFSLLYLLLFAIQYQARPAASWVAFALATGNAYYHLWFVALLVQLYLLFPLLRRLLIRAGEHGIRTVLLAALLLQLAWNLGAPILASQLPVRPLVQTLLSNRIFLSHIFYFVLGMVAGLGAASFDRRVRSLPVLPIILAVALSVTFTSLEWIAAVRSYGSIDRAPAGAFVAGTAAEPLLFLGTIVLVWQFVARLQSRRNGIKRALIWLGVLSLPVYLVHVFFQWLLARVMEPFGLTPATWGFYVTMFIATLLLSYLAARVFTRIPYGNYLAGAPQLRE